MLLGWSNWSYFLPLWPQLSVLEVDPLTQWVLTELLVCTLSFVIISSDTTYSVNCAVNCAVSYRQWLYVLSWIMIEWTAKNKTRNSLHKHEHPFYFQLLNVTKRTSLLLTSTICAGSTDVSTTARVIYSPSHRNVLQDPRLDTITPQEYLTHVPSTSTPTMVSTHYSSDLLNLNYPHCL